MNSQKVIQKFDELTARDAQIKKDAKKKKEDDKEMKRQQRLRDKLWRDERDSKYREDVETRKLERE